MICHSKTKKRNNTCIIIKVDVKKEGYTSIKLPEYDFHKDCKDYTVQLFFSHV